MMTFPIDVTKPFRYPSELKRLVEAVHLSSDYDETRWVEWKRTLDLATTESIRHIVRQILGFANRDPQVSAQWAEGYAYLLIGVSPGSLMGVTAIDPEQLISKVRPYIGSSITWTPEYINHGGVDVLVVVVGPPRPGDEIHALRKQLDSYKPGTILVRRHGQIDQADADELVMLQRRLLARTPEVELTVDPIISAIEVMPDFQSFIDTWIEEERDRRINARHAEKSQQELEANQMFIAAFTAAAMMRDSRSFAQYETEVDDYLAKARHALSERCVWSLAHHAPANLSIKFTNGCARNYTQVAVTLSIKSSTVLGYEGDILSLIESGKSVLPKPPDPWGTPPRYTASLPAGLASQISYNSKSFAPVTAGLNRGWHASNNGEALTIEFEACDLRPHATFCLPRVPIIINTEPGETIPVEWAATATNADGVVRGQFAITASESTLRWA